MGRRGWYIIYTHTGQENKVRENIVRMIDAADLKERVFRVEVPVEEETRIQGGRKKKITRKVFPGYILVEMVLDDETLTRLKNTAGVTGFVGAGRRPSPLPPNEVKNIMRTLGDEPIRVKPAFERGEKVIVLSGPFSEFTGLVQEVNPSREKLRILMEIFGRETPVELDFAQVEKI